MAQLRIIGRLNEFGGARGFKLNFKTPESRPMLNRQLRARCFLRRRKDDVLTELPPKRYAQLLIEGDPKVMTKYRQAEQDIVNYLAEIVRNAALASGLDTESARKAAGEKALRAQSAQHLVAVTTLKQIAVEAKRHAIDQWLKDFTATGKKVVVFGWHRAIVEWVADAYADGCRIQGGMSDAEKQACIEKFQTDETQQVISCSIKAAGVGITLTSASDVLFMEQGWNPADQDQASDRCHRIGQVDSVTVYTALCSETVDEDIYDLIQNKRFIVDAITDGTVPDPEQEQSVLGELLVRLANKGQ
jgi:SWI/SNF-related matrix-associated actin-dependent regulator 1 of chromatin subfamily A